MQAGTTNAGAGRLIARVLAVLAVGAAAIALFAVISGSLDSSGDGGKRADRQQREQRQQREDEAPTGDTYVVQPGDTLAGIAEKTNVPVDELENLNPDIDAQALPSGATLDLR